MTREEFIKQRCEIDKITEKEFEKQYRVVKCDCGQPYCKGYRCLDLDGLLRDNQELKEKLDKYENPEDMTLMMMWCTEQVKDENKKLKRQLEDTITSYTEEHNLRHNSDLKLDVLETQQKEFIKYLEDEIQKKREKATTLTSFTRNVVPLKHCLQKYKSIIGVSDEKKQI